ncbi:MAG: hypothetical protein NTV09_06395 [Bacteroidetes bacterium]|nr:hypothetical protein [Bacteroidota bacterium]
MVEFPEKILIGFNLFVLNKGWKVIVRNYEYVIKVRVRISEYFIIIVGAIVIQHRFFLILKLPDNDDLCNVIQQLAGDGISFCTVVLRVVVAQFFS